MPSRQTVTRIPGSILALVALLALAPAATGQDKAPRRPPEPFRVFVHASGFIDTGDPADAALKARLEEALPMVRERVNRRRRWFQLADSAETADITLRITHYRQGNLNLSVKGQRTESMYDCWATGYHYVDAVAIAGELRRPLSGLDHRCVDVGPSLRSAASHLAEELERFCKDNYSAVSRVKARANEKRPREEAPR
ncbi:MAG: hypothetical protein OXC11_08555 [Rhodospirillales bacterium]|nr:hypothetical protein [Rhodospirillales bacterium]